jgi:uncharacterized membrane protein YkoI
LIITAGLFLLVGVGIGAWIMNTLDSRYTNPPKNPASAVQDKDKAQTGGQTNASNEQAKISIQEAQSAALAVHDGSVEEIELNWHKGRLYYEVEFIGSGRELYVDANIGQVLNRDEVNQLPVEAAKITEEEMRIAALNEYQGTIEEVRLIWYNGQRAYKVSFDNYRNRVFVDAQTGQIIPHNQSKVELTEEQARKIASDFTQGTSTRTELDDHDGFPVYEIDVKLSNGQKAEIEVSATNGQIVKVHWDD